MFGFWRYEKSHCLKIFIFSWRIWIWKFYPRAHSCARLARATSLGQIWNFRKNRNVLFGFWRAARANARAPIKCQKMDSRDPEDTFWLLDRYSSLKSRIFRKCWKLSKNLNFHQKNGLFRNFETLTIFNIF